jgi:hypothetical protein
VVFIALPILGFFKTSENQQITVICREFGHVGFLEFEFWNLKSSVAEILGRWVFWNLSFGSLEMVLQRFWASGFSGKRSLFLALDLFPRTRSSPSSTTSWPLIGSLTLIVKISFWPGRMASVATVLLTEAELGGERKVLVERVLIFRSTKLSKIKFRTES